MFNFLRRKKATCSTETEEKNKEKAMILGAGATIAESARKSADVAAQKFYKPKKYDRSLLDDAAAKRNIKINAFKSGLEVKDPYTNDTLTLTKAEARMKYGEDWTKHLAEADHKIPLEQRYEQTKNNPWLSNDNVRVSSNSSDNLEVVSRKYNNAKRSKSNREFVMDEEYLGKTGVELTKSGKARAIKSELQARRSLKLQDFKDSVSNIIGTGHKSGIQAAKDASITGLTMSGIMNVTAVISGEKEAEDAIADTSADTGRVAVTGYVMGGGLTTVSHTLSGSGSKFLQALSKSNIPGNIITGVMLTGDTLGRYGKGEITTQECLLELGEKGLSFATTGYSMAVGQALIPIPVVGGAVGAFVGSVLTSNYYNQLMTTLQAKELEHQERLRIIAESERATREMRKYREKLEQYLSEYFQDYRDCFDDALSTIHMAFQAGDADGVIAGANQITRKLGGSVRYNNMDEFKEFLFDDTTDIF